MGSDMGYRAWQSMSDPPPEAFSDASVLGALILGWVPGVVFCLTVFGLVRAIRWLMTWPNPGLAPSPPLPPSQENASSAVNSENPYQSPRT
jgi:hypothetical protein